jgi:hypothetical protein
MRKGASLAPFSFLDSLDLCSRGAAERQNEALKTVALAFVGWVACPLLAQSGHRAPQSQCLLLGVKRTSCGGRFSFICALSASHGHADERATHLSRDTPHSTGAYANFSGNFVDAFTCAPAPIPDGDASGCFLDRPARCPNQGDYRPLSHHQIAMLTFPGDSGRA